ncbi:MAG: hypothetical protein ACYST6_13740 [Planctomycetota bacterium]|jgi:hypothetical protein
MRLTTEQRLQALERDIVVLHDMIKMLHRMMKDQGQLINEYIVQRIANVNGDEASGNGNGRPEQELYTFVCQKRFDKLEKDVKRTLQAVEGLKFKSRAG